MHSLSPRPPLSAMPYRSRVGIVENGVTMPAHADTPSKNEANFAKSLLSLVSSVTYVFALGAFVIAPHRATAQQASPTVSGVTVRFDDGSEQKLSAAI